MVYDKGAGDNGMRTVYKIDSYCLFWMSLVFQIRGTENNILSIHLSDLFS